MKKAANFCSFFICRFKFFILHLHTCPGNPGTSPNNIVEGGGISKRLLQITFFSAMFFYARMSANDPAGILAQIRGRPARRPQKIRDKKS